MNNKVSNKEREALEDFVKTIEATGGVVKDHKGYFVPVVDEEWVDLGDSYIRACAALGRKPKIVKVAS